MDNILHWVTLGIEFTGIMVIVGGSVYSLVVYARHILLPSGKEHSYAGLRSNLGRSILLGLEFLVAADIISTVAIEPTIERVGVLAVIVLIRTFLSMALEVEIEGKWPWQHSRITNTERKTP